jgi:hypothetical protein
MLIPFFAANKLRAGWLSGTHGLYDKPLGFFTSASFAWLCEVLDEKV